MLRYSAIGVFVVGFIIIILGATGVIANVTGAGVGLVLLGALLFGLSFVPKPAVESPVKAMSPAERLTKIFFAPAEVFQNLRRHPRWIIAVLIMTIVSAIYSNAFIYRLGAERIANYAIDKTLEMSLIANNDEARKSVELGRPQAIADAKSPVSRAAQTINAFVGFVFWFAFLALIFILFTLAMGGKINFWQAFSAAVYAGFPVFIINKLLSLIILFVKDPTDIHPLMGGNTLVTDSLNFLVNPADNAVLYVLLGAFSLLNFYWIWLMATGLKNTGENVSGATAWSAAVGVWLILLVFGVIMALLFPSFIS
jgi:hypothetical protein